MTSKKCQTCTYSCIYCQLGRIIKTQLHREVFYDSEQIAENVKKKTSEVKYNGGRVDYISFVPNGEPTLAIKLGEEIDRLKALKLRIAVLTNASLLWRSDVRNELSRADWISLKVDSYSEDVWRKVDRPFGSLEWNRILHGMRDFRDAFSGTLTTEPMLIEGINTDENELTKIAGFISDLGADKADVAVPTRPPAESWVTPAKEETVNFAYHTFADNIGKVEYLIGYEGHAFASTGNIEQDLLSISAVHPIAHEGVQTPLFRNNSDWSSVYELIGEGKLIQTEYAGKKFYMRNLPSRRKQARF